LAALSAKNLQRIRQGAYFNLIRGALGKSGERYRDALASVARGRAKEMSDVDLLVVSEAFHGSMARTGDELDLIRRALAKEISWLSKRGIYTCISFVPLRLRRRPSRGPSTSIWWRTVTSTEG
jgi:predicted nucleotidyltransferase